MTRETRGFTILELLMVIAIIGILLGIASVSTIGVIRRAREQQTKACVTLVNQGAAVYYAQEGQWPGSFGSKIANGNLVTTEYGQDYYELTASEVRETVKALVDAARMGRPVMDISGLYVSRNAGEAGSKAQGIDFMSAIHGTKKNGRKMSSSEMYFGYPEKNHGYFRRFKAVYYPQTDQLVFSKLSDND